MLSDCAPYFSAFNVSDTSVVHNYLHEHWLVIVIDQAFIDDFYQYCKCDILIKRTFNTKDCVNTLFKG